MEPFRITKISGQGVTMNRLPVTPAEEAQVRNAMMRAKEMKNEEEPVHQEGDGVNRAPRDGVSGRKDTIQH